MSLSSLKRNRVSINNLVEEASKISGSDRQGPDERFWKPTVDKANNGYAVIRFLPAPEGEEVPWTRYWSYGFKNESTNMWYIEKSLTSIGQKDPVGEVNSKLWNSGRDSDKDIARKQKRRLHHVSNIYVVEDPGNPENEGKVFLYQYGKKIYDKLMEAMQPKFADETPINPFDLWEGANFKIKICEVERFRNYDRSEFANVSALADDETLEKIYSQVYSLKEFTDPANYKSYQELEERLNQVLGISGNNHTLQQQQDLSTTAESTPIKSIEAPSPSFGGVDADHDDYESGVKSAKSYFEQYAEED